MSQGQRNHLRSDEEMVRQFLEATLPGTKVVSHDDGSRDSMYDLGLNRKNVRYGACEVTAVADASAGQLARLVQAKQAMPLTGSKGIWLLNLRSDCNAKALVARVDAVLAALDSDTDGSGRIQELRSLGVLSEHRGGEDQKGRVYFNVHPTGGLKSGFVDTSGKRLVNWLGNWLRSPEQKHNLVKLESSGLEERHLMVIVPLLTSAPFDVLDALINPDCHLPSVPLSAPDSLTHVWLLSTLQPGRALQYSQSGWRQFPLS